MPPFNAITSAASPISLDWVFNSLTSEVELFCVVSTAPFESTLQAFVPTWDDLLKPLRSVGNFWDVFQALITDLQRASQSVAPAADSPDVVPLAVSQWAVVRLLGQG